MEQNAVTRRRKKRRVRPCLAAGAVLVGAILLFCAIDARLRGPMMLMAGESVRESVQAELNAACAEAMGETGELIPDLSSKGTGEALIVNVDRTMLNLLQSRASALAQERIAGAGKAGVTVDLGSAMGPTLLSGLGPKLHAGFVPMGAVSAQVTSGLHAAGINQTLFTVELTLKATMNVLIAGRAEKVEAAYTMPVCQTVIVGSVPQVYTNVANEEDMLNLIPTDLP